MSIVICYMVPSAVAVCCAAALALREPQPSPIHRLMVGILAVLAVCMACYAQFFSFRFVHVIWFDLIYMMLAPFGAVLFYMFILTLTSLKEVSLKKRIAVFVPVAAYAVFLLSLALWMNPEEKLLYIGQVVQGEGNLSSASVPLRLMTVFGWKCISYVFPAVVTGILVWSGFKLYKYYHMLYDYYASSAQIQRVYGISIIALSVIFLPVAVFLMLVPHYASLPHWVPWTLSMTECLIIVFVTAIVFNLVFTAADLRAALSAAKEPPVESFQEQRKQQIADTLDKSVRESRVFLDPTLTIMSLAQEIGTNRTYLQSVIKAKYSCTFLEYINRCRIDYAKTLLMENQFLPIKEVASQSGFNSQSSFQRNFIQYEKMTPTQWLKSTRK